MIRRVLKAAAVLAVLSIASCGPAPVSPERAAEQAGAKVASLAAAIQAMDPRIDPAEAQRAARISYSYTAQLAREYQIEDAAIIHNIKVNNGTKPRGLCWHWAEDMEKRLKAENFRTLDLHRAIANYNNWRLEHSTAIISAKGASMYQGIVLDPWREGGTLTWKGVKADTRYNWTPRLEVFEYKRARGELTTRYVNEAGVPVEAR